MPQIEKALQRIRKSAAAEAASGKSRVADNDASVQQAVLQPEQIQVRPCPELLEQALPVTLDSETLSAHRVRGIQSSEAGEAAYKMLRTRVLQRMRSHGWRKLAVTSPRANAGKTLTAINLAVSLAHEPNQQVILVDLDLRSPSIGEYLGLDVNFGLSDHFKDNVPLGKLILKPTNLERLYVVPGAERMERSSEFLASQKMGVLTQTLVSTSPSTLVIFDLPPLLEADDMLTFAPLSDAVLCVVAQGETRQIDLAKSNELFTDLNLLGIVLNKSGDDAASDYY
jgi:Mrp family chromosome partitioning ATPase